MGLRRVPRVLIRYHMAQAEEKLWGRVRVGFDVLLTVHLSIILGNDQLEAQFLDVTLRLLCSSTCFEHYMLIIRRLYCIDAGSGIVTLTKWPSGAQVERGLSSPSTYAPDGQLE